MKLPPHFLKNVTVLGPNDCWEWKPFKGRYPYYARARMNAHRYVCQLYHGDLTGLVARHTCDNPKCVNPNHIIPGTQYDNLQDGVKRGRYKNNKPPGNLKQQQNRLKV